MAGQHFSKRELALLCLNSVGPRAVEESLEFVIKYASFEARHDTSAQRCASDHHLVFCRNCTRVANLAVGNGKRVPFPIDFTRIIHHALARCSTIAFTFRYEERSDQLRSAANGRDD
jgi:hypothetical protein